MSAERKDLQARAGFTIVELMLALVVLTIVMGSAIMATQRGSAAYRQSMINRDVDTQASRAMQRIMSELVAAGRTSLAPPRWGTRTWAATGSSTRR